MWSLSSKWICLYWISNYIFQTFSTAHWDSLLSTLSASAISVASCILVYYQQFSCSFYFIPEIISKKVLHRIGYRKYFLATCCKHSSSPTMNNWKFFCSILYLSVAWTSHPDFIFISTQMIAFIVIAFVLMYFTLYFTITTVVITNIWWNSDKGRMNFKLRLSQLQFSSYATKPVNPLKGNLICLTSFVLNKYKLYLESLCYVRPI